MIKQFCNWLFRISWVTDAPSKAIPCVGCDGKGQIDLVTQKPVDVATGNTITHLECGGLGHVRVNA